MCSAARLSDIKGAVPKILWLGGANNVALLKGMPFQGTCSKP